MTEGENVDVMERFRTVVAEDLDLLAALHDRELDDETLRSLRLVSFCENLGLDLSSTDGGPHPAAKALDEMIAALPNPLGPELTDDLAAAYADVYITNGSKCAPYESPWLDKDGLMRQKPTLAVRGCYARHSLKVPDARNRSEDHIVHELNFLAFLMRKTDWGDESLAEAQLFLERHPLQWLPDFAAGLQRHQAPQFYAVVAALTVAYLQQLHTVLKQMDLPLVAVQGLIDHVEGKVDTMCDDGKGLPCAPGDDEPL